MKILLERSGGWKRVRKLAIEDSPLSRSFFSNRCIFAFIDRFIFPVNEISYTRIRILFELRWDRNMDISSLRNEFRKLISRIKYILSLKIFYPIQALIYIYIHESKLRHEFEWKRKRKKKIQRNLKCSSRIYNPNNEIILRFGKN